MKKIILLFGLLALAACTNKQQNNRPQIDEAADKGLALYSQQRYFEATKWLQQAIDKEPRADTLLALIDAYGQLGDFSKAWQYDGHQLLQNRPERYIIKAQFEEGFCQNDADLLYQVQPDTLSPQWRQRFWQAAGDCYLQQGKPLLAAKHYIQKARNTIAENRKAANDQIVKALLQAREPELLAALAETTDIWTKGWLEAAFINFGADGQTAEQWLQQWQDHPASAYFLDRNQVSWKQRIAVLLPFSGRFNTVAKTVQKGMLTAALTEIDNRPDLLFFDTGSNGESLIEAWQAIQGSSVDAVIGPLDKTSIQQLQQLVLENPIDLPILLLNQAEQTQLPQFTLSPEGEAEVTADKMWHDGHRNVVIMAANSAWGERLTVAFAQHFAELGGTVVSNHYFQTEQHDYSAQLRKILGLVTTKSRAKRLQQILGVPINSKPTISSNLDAIFLAARPDFARLMVPQLKFHHAAKVPVYVTSHVFNGKNNTHYNKDLKDVRIGLAPLQLQQSELLNTLPFESSGIKNDDAKLFALGYDAYHLISRLQWLGQVNGSRIQGLSGNISIDFDGHIIRDLVWAIFKNGKIIAVEK